MTLKTGATHYRRTALLLHKVTKQKGCRKARDAGGDSWAVRARAQGKSKVGFTTQMLALQTWTKRLAVLSLA